MWRDGAGLNRYASLRLSAWVSLGSVVCGVVVAWRESVGVAGQPGCVVCVIIPSYRTRGSYQRGGVIPIQGVLLYGVWRQAWCGGGCGGGWYWCIPL